MHTPPFVPLSTNTESLHDKYTDLTKCKVNYEVVSNIF